MSDYKPVNPGVARDIARHHEKQVVVIVALDDVHDKVHYTTWGLSAHDKVRAAHLSEAIQRALQTEAELAKGITFEDFRLKAGENAARVEMLEAAIRKHRDQKADDRCWMDDLELYAVLGDQVVPDNRVGCPTEMLANCERFIARRCAGGEWPSYLALETELVGLRLLIRDLTDGISAVGGRGGWISRVADRPVRDGHRSESRGLPMIGDDQMPCPECAHMMTPLGCRVTEATMHVCPRCGTARLCDGEFLVPDLIRRCREFAKAGLNVDADPVAVAEWERLGVAEAINKPEDR